MDRRLGRPLPYQLSNPTRAHPCAINLCHGDHAVSMGYAVLTFVSKRYPPHKGRLLTRYSPVRHWSGAEAPSPFDLNVLCTPPAFILSQDQTLEQIVSYARRPKIFSSELVWLVYFFEYALRLVKDEAFSFQKNFEIRTRLFCLYFISCCSIVNDLREVPFALSPAFRATLLL